MKHLTLKDIDPSNYRYYIEEPDSNFSKERNYKVINQVLDENDRMQKRLHDQVVKNTGNITDILASFAKYKLDLGGEKKIDQYLGPGWQAKLYSEKIVEKIRWAEIMYKQIQKDNIQKGNTKFKDYYLT